ncbi:hypothetical protein MTP99_019636 [Tenebrio molitor]|jgi:hypothetical protein|nr:hypothetical protein MTP99_019636 [Tenebrio molitor]
MQIGTEPRRTSTDYRYPSASSRHNYTNNKYLSCPLSSYFCSGSSFLLLFLLVTLNPGSQRVNLEVLRPTRRRGRRVLAGAPIAGVLTAFPISILNRANVGFERWMVSVARGGGGGEESSLVVRIIVRNGRPRPWGCNLLNRAYEVSGRGSGGVSAAQVFILRRRA